MGHIDFEYHAIILNIQRCTAHHSRWINYLLQHSDIFCHKTMKFENVEQA